MITFVVPTIGRSTLSRTIDSLINQTDCRWKAIVVYDGSTALGITDTRFTEVVLPERIGRGNNGGRVRNMGLDCVDTPYVGFVDDDDYLNNNYVETFYKTIPADVIVWTAKYLDDYILPIPGKQKVAVGNTGIFFCYNFEKFPKLRFLENGAEDYLFLTGLSELRAQFTWSDVICYRVGEVLLPQKGFIVEPVNFK